jgi:hypothetical protein
MIRHCSPLSLRKVCSFLALTLACVGISRPAGAATINFDEIAVAPGTGSIRPANQYAAQGVTIQTVLSVTDTLGLGDIFTATVFQNAFIVANTDAAVSPSNLALYDRVVNGFVTFASDEVLMTFATPMTHVSVNSDDADAEVADVIRLLGLRSLGGGQYQIVAIASAFDNQTTPAGTLMSIVCPITCDAAIFEQTTEQEGFDNLTFGSVPEPASLVLLTLGLLGGRAVRRRRT